MVIAMRKIYIIDELSIMMLITSIMMITITMNIILFNDDNVMIGERKTETERETEEETNTRKEDDEEEERERET